MTANRVRTVRRVVVTGVGVLSPLGRSVEESWSALLAGHSGIVSLPQQYEGLPCRVAAPVPELQSLLEHGFSSSELRTMAPATALALLAAQQALDSAAWCPDQEEEGRTTGVALGVGMIDLPGVASAQHALQRGYSKLSPYFVPRILPNMAAGHISIRHGLRGPNHAVSTACATGAHAIGDAFRFVREGDAEVMLCGGAESCISPLAIAGFCRLRALSTAFNEAPREASRPFDTRRDGFVMGEGAAVLVLEELEHARRRGAAVLAEVLGYGLSGDASHLTAPREDGSGALLAMQRTLRDAGLSPGDVGYINAHATSTPLGDKVEAKAIASLLDGQAPTVQVSSSKGAHGHLLGAAGGLEAAFTVLACLRGMVPPNANLQHLDPVLQDYAFFVGPTAENWRHVGQSGRRVALKNSFGFGGTNACLCIGEFKE